MCTSLSCDKIHKQNLDSIDFLLIIFLLTPHFVLFLSAPPFFFFSKPYVQKLPDDPSICEQKRNSTLLDLQELNKYKAIEMHKSHLDFYDLK